MKIVGFGDFLIHFSPEGSERFLQAESMRMSFTGAEANVCAALALWEEETEFVTAVPAHQLAKKGLAFLKGCGIRTDHIVTGDGRMGTYYLENGVSLRPSSVIYDRVPSVFTETPFESYDWDTILQGADLFYLTGITPALSQNLLDCCKKILNETQKRCIPVIYDVNYRPALGSPQKAQQIFRELSPYIDCLISNEEHIKMLLSLSSSYGEDHPEKRLENLTNQIQALTEIQSVAITVRRTISASTTITYASYADTLSFATSPARRIQVVDRVGSGDAFSAGLIYGMIHDYSVEDTVKFASASCALKHTIISDINFSTVEEIKAIMNEKGYDVRR